MDQYSYAAELLKKYEGFNRVAVWDVNAWRIGYGSGTITDSTGKYRTVKQGDTTTEANALKDLTRRVKEFEQRVINKVGAEYWQPLHYQVKAALISLAYNYGNITKQEIIEAIKTGNNKKIAQAVINSTYNDNKSQSESVRNALRNRRKKEAAIIEAAPQSKGFNKKLLLIPIIIFAAYYLTKKK